MKYNKLEPDKTYYIVNFNPDINAKGRIYNTKNYEILEGIVNIDDGKIFFKSDKYGELRLNNKVEFFPDKVSAESNKYRLIFKFLKEDLCNKLIKDDFPPPPLIPNFNPIISSNPLRFGERNVCFASQSNTFGNDTNEQKILQLLGVTYEDIIVLFNILSVIAYLNDYSKKLIGKFTIIEMNSLYGLLKNLREFNTEYSNNEFSKLEKDMLNFEKKYKFKNIRAKIAAHKDSDLDLITYTKLWKNIRYEIIKEYFDLFVYHLEEILNKYYPNEKTLYFNINNRHLKGFTAERIEPNDYFPFHDFEM